MENGQEEHSADAFDLSTSPSDDNSLYALLGVSPNAKEEDIRKAYKNLAATLHPDKTRDERMRGKATEQFVKIQEAYEILGDGSKRDVYDVYGMEGIQAGMELAGPYVSREDQKKEWEAFREKKRKEAEEAVMTQKGMYVFKTDATGLFASYAPGLPRTPQVTNVYMSSGLDVPIESSTDWGWLGSQQDSLHVGGMVTARNGVGGGSFVAGYHRFYSNGAQMGVEGSVGLQTLLGTQITYPVTQFASLSGGISWNAESGVGVDVGTTCQIGPQTTGEFSWSIFPMDFSTMSLTIKHRWEKMLIVAKAEVGAITSLTMRLIRQLTQTLSGKLAFKIGSHGADFEIGGSRKISETSSAGMGVITSFQGVSLRLRFQKSGHNFEFPILLSTVVSPWSVIAAHIVPPLVAYVLAFGIVAPISHTLEDKKGNAEKLRKIERIKKDKLSSESAIAVIRPVASRKLEKELDAGRLVIIKALYGDATVLQDPATSTLDEYIKTEEDIDIKSTIDVTIPVQYMCDTGTVVFHAGYSKANLLGFYDPVPGSRKAVLIFFSYQGTLMKARIDDTEGGQLPGRGLPIDDSSIERKIKEYLDHLLLH